MGPRDRGKDGGEKHGWDLDPRIKEKRPPRETSEFGDRQGARKSPLVTGGDVRTPGGQGTGSSRPALCVSHREWGTGSWARWPAPPLLPETVTFLMSPRYREMKRAAGVGRRKRDPVRWPGQKVCQR